MEEVPGTVFKITFTIHQTPLITSTQLVEHCWYSRAYAVCEECSARVVLAVPTRAHVKPALHSSCSDSSRNSNNVQALASYMNCDRKPDSFRNVWQTACPRVLHLIFSPMMLF